MTNKIQLLIFLFGFMACFVQSAENAAPEPPKTAVTETAKVSVVSAADEAKPLKADPTQCELSLHEFPDFVYRDDQRRFSISLTRPFNFKAANARNKIRISYQTHKGEVSVACELDNKPVSRTSCVLPIDFSQFPSNTQLRIKASDAQTGQLFTEQTIQLLNISQAMKLAKEDKLSVDANGIFRKDSIRTLFMLPRPDETAARQWQVVREIQRIPQLFTPCLRVLASNDAEAKITQSLKKKFACNSTETGDGVKNLFLKLLSSPQGSSPQTLLALLSDYDMLQGTPLPAFRETVDAIGAVASKLHLKLYLTAPAPYPANPGLQKHYAQAVESAAAHRFAGYINPYPAGMRFTGKYPDDKQIQTISQNIAGCIYTGPGWQALLPLPLIVLSLGFWWLRIYSRYRHK